MKLLLDQNLSPRLVRRISRFFPGSKHVKDFQLTGDDDEQIWRFAGDEKFILMSKDSDFFHRSVLRGHPPKFIYLRVGNCSTTHIEDLILAHIEPIKSFVTDPHESVLILD